MNAYLSGTTAGGNDVHDFENVGIVQHKALHKMVLQNGYSYYATIQGMYTITSLKCLQRRLIFSLMYSFICYM